MRTGAGTQELKSRPQVSRCSSTQASKSRNCSRLRRVMVPVFMVGRSLYRRNRYPARDTKIPLRVSRRGGMNGGRMTKTLKAAISDDRVSATYRRLRELIVGGRLAAGARLIETELASRLGVSRTPVRAALLRLAQ